MKSLMFALLLCVSLQHVCVADFAVGWYSSHGVDEPNVPGTAADLPVESLVQLIWSPSGTLMPLDPYTPRIPQGDNVVVGSALTTVPGYFLEVLGPLPDEYASGYVYVRVLSGSRMQSCLCYDESSLFGPITPGQIHYCDIAPTNPFTLNKGAQATIAIKANGEDDSVVVGYCAPLTITVEIMPGALEGLCCEMWVLAVFPETHPPPAVWYYDPVSGSLWPGSQPAYQGPFFGLHPTPILQPHCSPPGQYTFYFAIDFTCDGQMGPDTQYDSVIVDIVP